MHSISKDSIPSMLIKLYVAKEYEKVKWIFLMRVMEKLGFRREWAQMIYQFISSVRYSIIVNGSPCGFFESSNGIRQGDSLSPFFVCSNG